MIAASTQWTPDAVGGLMFSAAIALAIVIVAVAWAVSIWRD